VAVGQQRVVDPVFAHGLSHVYCTDAVPLRSGENR